MCGINYVSLSHAVFTAGAAVIQSVANTQIDALSVVSFQSNCPAPAVAGRSLYVPFFVAGGAPPYSFASSTPLPPGLVFDPTGVLHGVPSLPSSSAVSTSFTVTDSVGTTSVLLCSFQVVAPLTVGSACPSSPRVGDPASPALVGAYGGVPPYAYLAASLPLGVGLDASTGELSGSF